MNIRGDDEMHERDQELTELRNYGHKLLNELRYPKIIGMLQENIMHIANIAEEYSKEADMWHSKYNECLAKNEERQEQIKNLIKANDLQSTKFSTVINNQAEKINEMKQNFERKLEELRSHRNDEIAEYGRKVQALADTQAYLDTIKGETEDLKCKLEQEICQCDEKKKDYENKRDEYLQQIEDNKAKISEYADLYQFKLDAQKKIADAMQAANDKESEANDAIADLNEKYGKEIELREKLESELEELKNKLNGSVGSTDSKDIQYPVVTAEAHNVQQNHDDDDDDGTM